jgi:hypothetical protein
MRRLTPNRALCSVLSDTTFWGPSPLLVPARVLVRQRPPETGSTVGMRDGRMKAPGRVFVEPENQHRHHPPQPDGVFAAVCGPLRQFCHGPVDRWHTLSSDRALRL